MKRRGFLKFLGMAAAAPVVAPLAEKCARAERPKAPALSEADKWRNLCGYGEKRSSIPDAPGATISMVCYDVFRRPFAVGDTFTIGDDPALHVVTKVHEHGEQS